MATRTLIDDGPAGKTRFERPVGSKIRGRARLVGWFILIAASAAFFVDAALPYFTFTEEAYHRFWDRAPWLLAHVVGGSVALFAGPWQFWTARRRGMRLVHRWTGRLYLGGVVLAGASAVHLGVHTQPAGFGAALLGLDAAWLASTAIAFVAIRNGNVARHREWMIRSYVLTLAFVSFRFWLMLAMSLQLADPATVIVAVGWASWIVPLLAVEPFLRRARTKSAT